MFVAKTAFSSVEPDINWHQFDTDHFTVIYDAKDQKVALHYATYAEESYALLQNYFSEPPERIVLVINDNTDIANGYATRLPRPLIHLNPVLPKEGESIGYFGNWAQELVLHELVHIMSFEPAHGIFAAGRWIFGTISSPLMLLPRWWLEGIAVEFETRLTKFGRLRSPYVESQLRAMALAGTLHDFDISLINEVLTPEWPVGQRPYLFGATLWNQMLEDGDIKTVDKLTQSYSRRIPFLLHGPVSDYTGKGYASHLYKSYDRLHRRTLEQVEKIKQSPVTTSETIFFDSEESRLQASPIISADGLKLAFINAPINEKPAIYVLARKTLKDSFVGLKPEKQIEVSGTTHLSWHPSLPLLIFNETKKRGYFSSGYDLFQYDLVEGKKKRLTNQQRAFDASINSENMVVFINPEGGRSRIKTMQKDSESTVKTILTSELDQRFASPVWLNQEEIAFSARGLGQHGNMLKLNIVSGEKTELLDSTWKVSNLSRTEGGISFSSSKSGITNIYFLQDGATEPKALTNTNLGLFANDYHRSSNTLVASEISHRGLEAVQLSGLSELPPPDVKPLISTKWPEPAKTTYAGKMSEPSEYRGGPYLWPQYWLPFIQPFDDGIQYQATVAGQDPLQKHLYAAVLSYDTFSQKPSFSTQYTHASSKRPWTLALSDISYKLRGLGDTIRRDSEASAVMAFPVKNGSRDWNYTVGYAYSNSEIFSSSIYRSGPKFSLRYSDVGRQKGRMISAESGKSLSIATQHYLHETSSLAYSVLGMTGNYYFSSFLPKRHTLNFNGRILYTPEKIPRIFGGTTSAAPLSIYGGGFLMRGYYSGQFLGKNLLGSSIEYRFPVSSLNWGLGTWPVFLRRMHSRIIADAITLDGLAIGNKSADFLVLSNRSFAKSYYGTGLEIYLDSNIGYSYPISFFAAIYQPMNREISRETRYMFGFLL